MTERLQTHGDFRRARAAIAKSTTTENKSKYPLIERGPFEAWWEDEGEDITFYCGDDPLAMAVAGWEAALKQPLYKATPALLEALEEIVSALERGEGEFLRYQPEFDAARAAIAKAKEEA